MVFLHTDVLLLIALLSIRRARGHHAVVQIIKPHQLNLVSDPDHDQQPTHDAGHDMCCTIPLAVPGDPAV